MQTILRRRIAVAALALAIPALSACGFEAQTDKVYQPAPGVNDRSGAVDVLGALIVSAKPGSGVFITTLSNNNQNRADKLLTVAVQGAQVAPGGEPTIGPGAFVNLQTNGGIPVSGSSIKAGDFVTARLTFAHGDPVTLKVPVLVNDGPYAGINPDPTATPNSTAASGAAIPKKSPKATPTATGSPTAGSSPTAGETPSASPGG